MEFELPIRRIEVEDLIKEVNVLFKGHRDLILGFNICLPEVNPMAFQYDCCAKLQRPSH
jgi:histone deacetylase complex regulatory component SIN3